MAVITTKAIVLSAIKYSDSSLIVKCFTEEEGVKSYLVRGVLKKKKGGIKAAYFQPLTQLKLVANHHHKSTLHSIKEVQILNPYTTIYKDIVKQSVVLFLSEVLVNSILEEEKNKNFYHFIETALIWLDLHEKIANFHLLFLYNITRFFGFYPDFEKNDNNTFDLLGKNDVDFSNNKNVISGNNLHQFKKLLGMNFDSINEVSFNKKERQQVLHLIIKYFELHLDGFKKPKSLQVLEAVFS